MNYSNQRSLELAYGVEEVAGLMRGEAAVLEKAAEAAKQEIDGYLHTAGYLLPLIFTEWVNDVPSTLPGQIQRVSDAFTASNMASAEDLHKQRYDLDRAEGIKWLEKVATGEIRIQAFDGTYLPGRFLDQANGLYPSGGSLATTMARPRVFTQSMQPLPFPGPKVQL